MNAVTPQSTEGRSPVESTPTPRPGVGVIDLTPMGWMNGVIQMAGPDAAKFLHSQTTNDVQNLPIGGTQANAAVDVKGKVQGLFTLCRLSDDTFWVVIDRTWIQGLMAHWQKYKIIEDFSIEDCSDQYIVLTVQGVESRAFVAHCFPEEANLNTPVSEKTIVQVPLETQTLTLIPQDLTGDGGVLIIVPNALKATVWQKLVASPSHDKAMLSILSSEDLNTYRIEAGIPRLSIEVTTETLLPEVAAHLDCTSYNKGCYLGQEVIAKIKTYGASPKAMAGLLFSESMANGPPCPSDINIDGKTVGTITSMCQSPTLQKPIALAILDRAHRAVGQVLHWSMEGQPFEATVVSLPFYKPVSQGLTSEQLSEETLKAKLQEALHHFAQGQDDDAITQLRDLTTQAPNFVDAFEALGAILSRQPDHNPAALDEAIACMEHIIGINPDHVMAHSNLSIYWLKKGNKDKAEDEKAKATVAAMRSKAKAAGLDFAKLETQRQAAEEAKRQQLQERVHLFRQALAHSPDDPLGNFGLGSTLLELQQYAEAIAPLEATLAKQPNHTVAYLSLGKALEALNETDKAKAIYQKGIEVASVRGDLMPLQEMESRLKLLMKP